MKSTDIPSKIQLPFGASAGTDYIRTVPVPSQIGITNGAASFTDGFPPDCFVPEGAGGYPPDGRDTNYVLNISTAWNRWYSAGGGAPYDATFSSAIGGYPVGAMIARADGTGFWLSTLDDNTNNPESVTTGWVPISNNGSTSITGLTNANVTLTTLQYAKDLIVLSGTLTGNINVIFPAIVKAWRVVNNTTGSYAITAKTASGSGVTIGQSGIPNPIQGDGTNILYGIDVSSVPNVLASGIINTSGDTTIALPTGFFRELTLTISGLTTTSDYAAWLRVNSDTEANYNTQGLLTDAGATFGYTVSGSTGIPLTETTLLFKNSAASGIPFEAAINIISPMNTALNKIIRASGIPYLNSNSNFGFLNIAGQWKSNSAITSLALLLRNAAGVSPSGSMVNASGGTWYITGKI